MRTRISARTYLIVSMLIFGSIGVFVRNISLPSSLIALVRAAIGFLFLLALMFISGSRISLKAIKSNLLHLCLSGVALGFNWILLFESYRYTSVAVSTLCYYTAPLMVVLLSPLVLKERLTLVKVICFASAGVGMALISGVLGSGIQNKDSVTGILYGISAAVLYSSVILVNKRIHNIGALDRTLVQIGIAAIVLLPYNLFTVDFSLISLSTQSVLLLVAVGVVHTGLAYQMYFGSIEHLSAQSVAIFSYIDPVIAVLSSVLLLREGFRIEDGIGTMLILGAAVVSELSSRGKGISNAGGRQAIK